MIYSFYNKSTTNTIMALISTGLSILLSTALVPIMVLSMGAESWARYGFFLLYVAFLQCVEASLQVYTLQLNAISYSSGYVYEWWRDSTIRSAMMWIGSVSCFAIFAIHVVDFVDDGDMRVLLSIAIVNAFPRAFSAILKGNLLGQESQGRYYFINTVFTVGRPLCLLLCILLLGVRSVLTLALLYLLFSVFEMIVLWLIFGRWCYRKPEKTSKGEREDYLLPSLFFANLLSTLSTNFDKIIAYGSLGLGYLSVYTFAAQIAALLTLFVNSAVTAFTPRFRELCINCDYDEVRRLLLLLSAINNFLVLAGAALFLTNAEFFLSIFRGYIDREALLNTFSVLAGAVFLNNNLWFPSAIATSSGKSYFSVVTNIIFIAAYLCAFLGLRGHYYDSAFALSALCSAVVTAAAGLFYFKQRVLHFSLSGYGLVAIALPLIIIGITYMAPAIFIKRHYVGAMPALLFAGAWLFVSMLFALRCRHLLATRK